MRTRAGCAVVLIAVVIVSACSDSGATDSSDTTTATAVSTSTSIAPPAASTTTEAPTTTSTPTTISTSTSTTTTIAATTTIMPIAGPLEFVDGAFLGIKQGTLMTDAARALGLKPVLMSSSAEPVMACNGTEDPWIIQSGGLTLVFEALDPSTPEAAFLTNWNYRGGPVAGYTELVAPPDIRIGDHRDEVIAANPDNMDFGSEIHVFEPAVLRFYVVDDAIEWFGIIDCVFEG